MEKSLKSIGHDVLIACDGEEGLRMAQENHDRIDLWLCDVDMPKMRGDEAVGVIAATGM